MSEYCQGCQDLQNGTGGENQMAHYGGCLDDPADDFIVPENKRRKTIPDELERKAYQITELYKELNDLNLKLKELSDIQENYLEKMKQLEATEIKINNLSELTRNIEKDMEKLSRQM